MKISKSGMDFINCLTFVVLLSQSIHAVEREAIFMKQIAYHQVYASVGRTRSSIQCSASCQTSCIGYIYDKYNKVCKLVGERVDLETPPVLMMLLSKPGKVIFNNEFLA